ncbi:uncharacterized protein METZ01_LOCUS434637, partial [marine metagenome]
VTSHQAAAIVLGEIGMVCFRVSKSNPRVKCHVKNIDNKIDQHIKGRENQNYSLYDRIIPSKHGVDC